MNGRHEVAENTMHTAPFSIRELASSLIVLQRSIYVALQDKHPFLDHRLLTDAPRFGSVSTSDAYWEFTRHGRGFRFEEVPNGTVIDILIYMPTEPEFFDALRLSEYAESIGVNEISFNGHIVDASSERAIEMQLGSMVESGALSRNPSDKHLYRF